MNKKYSIVPLNEGNAMNYCEFVDMPLESAKVRAKELCKGLQRLLYRGTIKVQVIDIENVKLPVVYEAK